MRVICRAALILALGCGAVVSAQQTGGGSGRSGRPAPSAAAAKPAPPHELQVPFQVGETLTYDVAWSQYLVAGSATCRVVDKRASGSSAAYYIVAEGRPLPLIAR